MAISKQAALRYRILDDCLRKGNYTFENLKEKLSEAFGKKDTISDSTVRKDLKNLRDIYKADIITSPSGEGHQRYYKYSDPNYSIFKVSIEDYNQIVEVVELLRKYAAGNSCIDEVIERLETKFSIKPSNENVVSFEHNSLLRGVEYLGKVTEAAGTCHTLLIAYKPFSSQASPSVLRPFFSYYVKQYNSRWFVVGRWKDEERLSVLALDRIEKVNFSKLRFVPCQVDVENCFCNVVGVTLPREGQVKETIIMRFSPKRYPYVLTKSIHSSQKQLDDCQISITVVPTQELMQQVLAFGPDVEIVSPVCYRDQVKKKIEEMWSKYRTV